MKQEMINPQIKSEDVHNLLPYLPSEIILDILSRIPVLTVMSCKCVCKAWRDLLNTSEFVQSHLSKSVPGLVVYAWVANSKRYRIIEFAAGEDPVNIVIRVDLPFISGEYIVHSSVNGLLFVCNKYIKPFDPFVCNLITREYIRLPSVQPPYIRPIYGFGLSKMSGQYKVVGIDCGGVNDCQVYTVGSGSWRRIEFHFQLWFKEDTVGAFLNGNLHWLAYKKEYPYHGLICCLDLETECFSTFSSPPSCDYSYMILSVLGGYLCVCDTAVEIGGFYEIDIWLMKEYRDEKSWIKEFHFDSGYGNDFHCPVKVFSHGDILMQWGSTRLLYYKKHGYETFRVVDMSRDDPNIDIGHVVKTIFATVYTPSFVTLKTFTLENVSSF